jgi:protein gp37
MSDNSKIEWTEATLNIATGCTKVSVGCANCYITRTMPFRVAGRTFEHPQEGKTPRDIGATTGVLLHPERVVQPLRWRRGRRIFINSLADWLHDDVPDSLLVDLFAVAALTPQHTYQLTTKRPARGRALLGSDWFPAAVERALRTDPRFSRPGQPWPVPDGGLPWPLPNAWIGVSAENQDMADQRIPILVDTPAAVRWVSAEPLVGPVTFRWARWEPMRDRNHLDGLRRLDWVVVGGESGADVRPMHPDWARQIRDECVEAGVPFFFKQWGEWAPTGRTGIGASDRPDRRRLLKPLPGYGEPCCDGSTHLPIQFGPEIGRVGVKAAGRVLDGRTWDQYPA